MKVLAPGDLAVAGDISPDGREVLIKTYDTIVYWRLQPGEELAKLYRGKARSVPQHQSA